MSLPAINPVEVLFLWPNVVCYFRAALGTLALGLAWWPENPDPSLVTVIYVGLLMVFALSLDWLDGYLARRLHQESSFGAALDVLVDSFQRGGMWILALGLPGFVAVFIELVVFACTHSHGGKAWKVSCFQDAPWLVAAVMANGFKSPLGAITVAGLHFLPLWLWLLRTPERHSWLFLSLGPWLILGRCLAVAVELWVIKARVASMICEDAAALAESRRKGVQRND